MTQSHIDRPTDGARSWQSLLWFPVYACAAVMAALRTHPCSNGSSLCVHPYWLEFWLRDYSSGFERRALLGAIVHRLSPGHLDVAAMNAAAMAVCLAMIVTMVVVAYRRSETFWARATLAVLLASPLFSVFVEVLGDPLEVVFVLFLGCTWLMTRVHAAALRWLWAAIFCVVALLVHEAALFLFVPAIMLMAARTRRPMARSYAAFAMAGALLLGALLLLGNARPPNIEPYRAVNSRSGEVLPRMVEPTPPFGRLLRQEVKDAFGSSRAAVLTVLRFPRAWTIPCLALVLVLGLVCAPGERSSLWGYWLHVTVCSAPLYAIAHDWGRFSAITFWVALVLTYHARAQGFEDSPAAPAVAASTSSSMALRNAGVILGLTAFLVLGVKANSAVYRYMGMSLRSLVVIPIFAVPWLGWRLVLRWRSSRGQQV